MCEPEKVSIPENHSPMRPKNRQLQKCLEKRFAAISKLETQSQLD